MADLTDKAREEFLAEAQEILEALSRNLLSLDAAFKAENVDPSLINEAFRGVHTIKGLAGLFGANELGDLSRRLEDLLDQLRLGRRALSAPVLDVLFGSLDVYTRLLEAEKAGHASEGIDVDRLFRGFEEPGPSATDGGDPLLEYELDPGILAVLTEYEEHRLRVSIQQGLLLYRLRVRFELSSIDRALEDVKERAKRHGEILTYLPTSESSAPDTIEIDLLLASAHDLETLQTSLASEALLVEALPRRHPVAPLPTSAPPAALDRAEPLPPEPSLAVAGRSLRSLTQTVRVDIRRLDHLMNVVGELGIVRGTLGRLTERLRREGERRLSGELQRLHRNFDRRLGDLQTGLLEARMVPLGQVFERLARIVRQVGRELSKEIRLVITGAETEIDKLIVEELSDPLMHIMRNAIDHGIETVQQRLEVDKPPAGTIALNAYQKGNHVMIEVEDDGRGIDEGALLERAVKLGEISSDDARGLSREETLALIFVPGLSTRDHADDVSGRGVGMDVVKTNIGKLGGVVDVRSAPGIGTKLTITLPITLAIVSALLVRVRGQIFAIPLATISEALHLDEGSVRQVDRREVITLRGSTLPLCRLGRLFDIVTDEPQAGQSGFIVVVALGGRRLGLVVDHLFGQQDIVIKPLGRFLSAVRGFAGATELGDQHVGLVLDTASILEEVLAGDPRELGEARARG